MRVYKDLHALEKRLGRPGNAVPSGGPDCASLYNTLYFIADSGAPSYSVQGKNFRDAIRRMRESGETYERA